MIQFTIDDTINLAIINVARKLKIHDFESKYSKDLYDEIKFNEHSIFQLLNNYISAYSAFLDFRNKHKKTIDYTSQEQLYLDEIIKNRNTTRKILEKAIKSLKKAY